MLKRSLALLLFVFVSIPLCLAETQDTVLVSTKESVTWEWLKRDKQVKSHIVDEWFKVTGLAALAEKGIPFSMAHTRIDCKNDKMGFLELIPYGDDKLPLKGVNSSKSDNPQMTDVIPGSAGDDVLQAVCSSYAKEFEAIASRKAEAQESLKKEETKRKAIQAGKSLLFMLGRF